jgi:hypothetical protein
MSRSGLHKMRLAPSPLRAIAIVGCVLAGAVLGASAPQSITVTTAAVSIPPELAPPVTAALSTDVVTVTTGTTKLEFWWVKTLALNDGAAGAPSWAAVPDGSLVGALRLGADWSDIRGFTVRPGVYTLRFALQPQNGDHLGISPNREFLLPAPAADDLTPDPIGYDGAVALARKTSRRAHPGSISIDPPTSPGRPLSTATNDLGHQIVIVSVPTSAGALTFGIVVHGTIEH